MAPVATDPMAGLSGTCADVRQGDAQDAVDGVGPAYVARPGSTEETGELLRAAAAYGLAVVARGAGTKLTWAAPPTRVDLVVDLSALSAVVDHAAGDLVVVAEAGCPLADLQAAVAPAGQRLAIDEPIAGSTLGGLIATNGSGPSRMLYLTLRELMIGTTVVRADGVVAHSGGRVVKNVAGYDLGKLMTGSFGTLALVTRAVFRLHPVPESTAVLMAPAADAGDAGRLAAAVIHSDVVPSAVEVDWPGGGGSVAILLEGSERGVAARAEAARGLLGAAVEVSAGMPGWWGRYPWRAGEIALKLTCALSGVPRLLATGRDSGAVLRGSAGAGVLYGALPAEAADRVVPLRELCTSLGGSLVVLDAPPEVKARLDLWGPVPALDLMRAVKDQFDPDHRLAPGRFVGGI
ncbi:MAG: FAD-binding oxidoreductase [Geodermatophilaceae bacterium]|nr:FAD-binding oxidoreductase [Geodermatophilaceae bacterium]MDQ3457032.1 FAD-binding oxidoreductase [Actinomycetota bacterium]